MSDEIDVPTRRQVIAELKREKIMRNLVYPKMVGDGRMRERDAVHRAACIDRAIEIIEASPEEPAREETDNG
jgi:hypothetical protein